MLVNTTQFYTRPTAEKLSTSYLHIAGTIVVNRTASKHIAYT